MPQAANNGKVDPDDPTASMQQSMKTMNIMMPLMSAIFCLQLPAGMGIYWIAGAVVRSIQQIFINKYIDNTDIDAEIAKSAEKYKEKAAKNATANLDYYAKKSTKNVSDIAKNSDLSEEEIEAAIKKSREFYKNNDIRKDSLLAKVNMVRDFNEYNDNK